jgi:hypothetical protein
MSNRDEPEVGDGCNLPAEHLREHIPGQGTLRIELAGIGGDVGEFRAFPKARGDDAKSFFAVAALTTNHRLVPAEAEDDQVVDDPAMFVQKEAVARAAFGDGDDGKGKDVLEPSCGEVAPVEELPMWQISKSDAFFTAPAVLRQDPLLVLDRHVPAAERGHEGLARPMPSRQRVSRSSSKDAPPSRIVEQEKTLSDLPPK